MTSAIAVSGGTAALANSPPIADNFQPFMWRSPQVIGQPMSARQLGMLDRVSKAPAAATTAAYVPRYAPMRVAPTSYSALYEGRAAFTAPFNYNANKPVEWTGGNGGHSSVYGDNVPMRPFEAQEIRTGR
ncbi:MAG TPA: hypothetical protein VKV96_13240 [Roseiarcus sp.]|nr:hypothetical protein [Roseiarcus sp.]